MDIHQIREIPGNERAFERLSEVVEKGTAIAVVGKPRRAPEHDRLVAGRPGSATDRSPCATP